jgi:hypothetical protein
MLSSERENTVLQWTLKLNSAPAAEEAWDLKGPTLKGDKCRLGKKAAPNPYCKVHKKWKG